MGREYDVALLDGGNVGRRLHSVHRQLCVRDMKDGKRTYTGMAFGYARVVLSLRAKYGLPDGLYVCGDRGSARRKAIYEGYKASRKTREWDDLENFRAQAKLADRFLPYLHGVHLAFAWGEEADDVMATLARRYEREGKRVLVVSNDGDMLQLVSRDVHVLQQKGPDERILTPERLLREDGYTAEQLTHMMALSGDPGDDAPGVPGIGEKTAEEIVNRWPDLVPVILGAASPGDPRGAFELEKGGAKTRVYNLAAEALENYELVIRAHALTKLYTDLTLKVSRSRRDPAALRRACEKLGFHSLLEKRTFAILAGLPEG